MLTPTDPTLHGSHTSPPTWFISSTTTSTPRGRAPPAMLPPPSLYTHLLHSSKQPIHGHAHGHLSSPLLFLRPNYIPTRVVLGLPPPPCMQLGHPSLPPHRRLQALLADADDSLAGDALQEAQAGHPRTAMGMADVGYLRYRHAMWYNPAIPSGSRRTGLCSAAASLVFSSMFSCTLPALILFG